MPASVKQMGTLDSKIPSQESSGRLFGIGYSFSRDNQLIIPGEGRGRGLLGTLVGVVRKQPDLSELLRFLGSARAEVIRSPFDHQLRRPAFSGDPKLDKTVCELVFHTRSSLDVYLERHPFVRKITKTIPFWRKERRRVGFPL